MRVVVHHLFISDGHNFFGRHGLPAHAHGITDVASARCRAGWGIEGDRFYGYRANYKGQVTFFSWETYQAAKAYFRVPNLPACAFRRNIVIEGVDLMELVGADFVVGGVEFAGTEESRPCYWMNSAVAPGAEGWLRGRGGLRARVLRDGELRPGETDLHIVAKQGILSGLSV